MTFSPSGCTSSHMCITFSIQLFARRATAAGANQTSAVHALGRVETDHMVLIILWRETITAGGAKLQE